VGLVAGGVYDGGGACGPRNADELLGRILAWPCAEPYDRLMSGPINLADPAFEPTDEQLQDLSRRAFAGVAAAHAKSLVELRVRIAEARREALEALDRREREGK